MAARPSDGVDESGGDDVGPDAAPGALVGHEAAQPLERGLRRVVGREAAAVGVAGQRADEHDGRVVGHRGQRGPHHQEVAAGVDPHDVIPLLGVGALEPGPGPDAHVEHQAVDAAEELAASRRRSARSPRAAPRRPRPWRPPRPRPGSRPRSRRPRRRRGRRRPRGRRRGRWPATMALPLPTGSSAWYEAVPGPDDEHHLAVERVGQFERGAHRRLLCGVGHAGTGGAYRGQTAEIR